MGRIIKLIRKCMARISMMMKSFKKKMFRIRSLPWCPPSVKSKLEESNFLIPSTFSISLRPIISQLRLIISQLRLIISQVRLIMSVRRLISTVLRLMFTLRMMIKQRTTIMIRKFDILLKFLLIY